MNNYSIKSNQSIFPPAIQADSNFSMDKVTVYTSQLTGPVECGDVPDVADLVVRPATVAEDDSIVTEQEAYPPWL